MSQRSETRFRDYVCRDCGKKFTNIEASNPMYFLQDILSPPIKCPKCSSRNVETTTKAIARKIIGKIFKR